MIRISGRDELRHLFMFEPGNNDDLTLGRLNQRVEDRFKYRTIARI
jgi:hypothetical protein